eukprot:1320788-Amorphochlora_amoeboformis.AAC.1
MSVRSGRLLEVEAMDMLGCLEICLFGGPTREISVGDRPTYLPLCHVRKNLVKIKCIPLIGTHCATGTDKKLLIPRLNFGYCPNGDRTQ